MTELNGTLQGIGLQPLLSFLEGLHNTGSLVVEDGPWAGTLMLTEGQLVGATFGKERGLAALDAILFALPRGRFTFSSDITSCEVNIVLQPGALGEHLESIQREAVRLIAAVPSLGAVPRVLETADAEGQVTVGRRALRLLLALDGRRDVALLAKERGVLPTLQDLAELTELGVVTMDDPTTESPRLHEVPALSDSRDSTEPAPSGPDRPAGEPQAGIGDRGLRAGREERTGQRRPLIEPATPAQPTPNGASNGRHFWR